MSQTLEPKPSVQSQPPSLSTLSFAAIVAAAAAAVLLLVAVISGGLVPARYGEYAWTLPLAIAATIGMGVAALSRPKWVMLVFVFACIAVSDLLEATYIPLGFMKLYIQDLVFGFNVVLIALRTSVGRTPFRRITFNHYVIVFVMLGLWGVANGLFLSKNPFDAVLGDFRRSFFYFLNYFVVLYLVDDLGDARRLRRAILAGAMTLIALGLFQIATGRFHVRRADDAAHVLSWKETTFLSFAIFYAVNTLVFSELTPKLRRAWMAVALAGVFVTAVANFRATWLGLLGGFFFIFWFLPTRKRTQFALAAVALTAFIVLAVASMWDTQVIEGRTLGQQILMKAKLGDTVQDINVVWRFQSYQAALETWRTRPFLGTGLGTYLTFQVPTSTGGSMLTEGHNVHNSLLWVLMTTGVVGLCVLLAMHGAFLWAVTGYIRGQSWAEGKVVVMTAGAFYVSLMVATCFQNFLENATPVTVFSAVAALAILTIYHSPGNQTPTPATAVAVAPHD